MGEVRESHFISEAMESATVRFAAQQGDSNLHKQLKSRLQQFKDCLDTAEKDHLFELDELFHKTIAEFRFQPDSGKSQTSLNLTWTVSGT